MPTPDELETEADTTQDDSEEKARLLREAADAQRAADEANERAHEDPNENA